MSKPKTDPLGLPSLSELFDVQLGFWFKNQGMLVPGFKRFSADDLDSALGLSLADNLSKRTGSFNWLSNLSVTLLKKGIDLSQQQGELLKSFGIPAELSVSWIQPLISQAEIKVAQGRGIDPVAQANLDIESEYAKHLKRLVSSFTQSSSLLKAGPASAIAVASPENPVSFDSFNAETCRWACEELEGQLWLLIHLNAFTRLEWAYTDSGETRLAAMKQLLRSVLQVIAGEVFLDKSHQPYRKQDCEGNWRQSDQEYLEDCEQRLMALLKHNAFDIRYFALHSPDARLGVSEWRTVPGSRLFSVQLRHYPRPSGIKGNGKTLYLASPMINRCEIFDLAPGKSVIEGMLKLGYDLYMVDYGNPASDQHDLGLDFYGKTVHYAYLELIQERHPGQLIDVMAYCMGGSLFMPYLARHIEEAQRSEDEVLIRQVVLMTTPVLFDDEESGHKAMRDLIRKHYDVNMMDMFFGQSNIPPQAIEHGMHSIQPGVSQSVAEGFYSRAHFPGAIKDAAPFMHWLHSGTRFPVKAHREWIERVFMNNEIWLEKYCLPSSYPELDGRPVNMEAIKSADIALFDYRGLRDPIAPVGSCRSSERWGRLEDNLQLTRAGLNRTIEKNVGHIFVVSKKLLADFLTTASDFLSDEPPPYRVKR